MVILRNMYNLVSVTRHFGIRDFEHVSINYTMTVVVVIERDRVLLLEAAKPINC